MTVEHRAIAILKIFLVVLFGVLVMLQVFSFPGQFAHMANEQPEDAHLRWPLTVLAALLIACVQVIVVAIWRLLTLVTHDRIFSTNSFRWVNAIIGAIGAGWVMLVGVFLWVGLTADDPGIPLLLFLFVTGVTVVGLLMFVMRALLQQATSLRNDMDMVL